MRKWSSNKKDAVVWKNGCTEWITRFVSNGWKLYYMNFMFEPLHGPRSEIVPQMHRTIEKFYGQFCLRFAHNGRADSEQERMPKLWLFPDLPVHKHEKTSLREVTINGGLHFNGPLLIPPVSRFKECPIKHLAENQDTYAAYGIERIHIVAGDDISGLADYAIKCIANGKADKDDILVLPRPVKDLPSKRNANLSPQERLFKNIQSSLNVSDEIAQRTRDDLVENNRPRTSSNIARIRVWRSNRGRASSAHHSSP